MRRVKARSVLLSSVALLALPASAIASGLAPAPSRSPARTRSAIHCAALFGDARAQAGNASARAHRLDWVDEEASGITLAHSHPGWGDPVRLQLRGLELRRIEPSAGQASAIFDLSPAVARTVGCPAGEYALALDHELMPSMRILAILQRGVLVEHRGGLGFVALPGTELPRWFVAWRMRATVRYPAVAERVYFRRGGDDD